MDRMRAILQVHSPKFAMPIALKDFEDVEFVSLNEYLVTPKADGVRCWLFRDTEQSLSWSRDGMFRVVDVDLPDGTILDVEQMPDG